MASDEQRQHVVRGDREEKQKSVDALAPRIEREAGEEQECVAKPQTRKREVDRQHHGQKHEQEDGGAEGHEERLSAPDGWYQGAGRVSPETQAVWYRIVRGERDRWYLPRALSHFVSTPSLHGIVATVTEAASRETSAGGGRLEVPTRHASVRATGRAPRARNSSERGSPSCVFARSDP